MWLLGYVIFIVLRMSDSKQTCLWHSSLLRPQFCSVYPPPFFFQYQHNRWLARSAVLQLSRGRHTRIRDTLICINQWHKSILSLFHFHASPFSCRYNILLYISLYPSVSTSKFVSVGQQIIYCLTNNKRSAYLIVIILHMQVDRDYWFYCLIIG